MKSTGTPQTVSRAEAPASCLGRNGTTSIAHAGSEHDVSIDFHSDGLRSYLERGRARRHALFALHREPVLPKNWERFVDRRRQECQQQLAQLRVRHSPNTFSQPELPLAGYLFSCALRSKLPSHDTINRLKNADKACTQTRNALHYGRGNVTTDLERSGLDSFRRTMAARDAGDFIEASREESIALALYAGSGNCEEFARVSTVFYVPRMYPNESVHQVGHCTDDHTWAEVRDGTGKPSADDIIIDAWTRGPAVLRDDASYAAKPEQLKTIASHKTEDGLTPYFDVLHTLEAIRGGNHLQSTIKAIYSVHYEDSKPPKGMKVWQPESVLHETTRKAVSRLLERQSAMHHDITATHIARTCFGMSIRPAAKAAPDIVSAAKALLKDGDASFQDDAAI